MEELDGAIVFCMARAICNTTDEWPDAIRRFLRDRGEDNLVATVQTFRELSRISFDPEVKYAPDFSSINLADSATLPCLHDMTANQFYEMKIEERRGLVRGEVGVNHQHPGG